MRRGWFVLLVWRLLNPATRMLAGAAPWWVLVETTGRKSGRTRRTPLAVGRYDDSGMWVIAVHGRRSGWVLNAEAATTVRFRHRLRWREATTTLHEWSPEVVATMGRYARLGPRVTAEKPLLVQFRPVG